MQMQALGERQISVQSLALRVPASGDFIAAFT
jgi:hypothetical protein